MHEIVQHARAKELLPRPSEKKTPLGSTVERQAPRGGARAKVGPAPPGAAR